MALTKVQKEKVINDLKEKIAKQKAVVFAVITGLKVKDLANLRKDMKKKDCELKVAKKTLISSAFKQKKIDVNIKKLEGEIALGFGYKDEVLPFKTLYEFSKGNENLKILGGFFEDKFRSAEEIIALAKIPSKQELFAKVVGSISSPISGFVNVLQGNIKGLVYVLTQIK